MTTNLKIIYFIIKLLLHYFDFATDITLILDIKERSVNPDYSSETKLAYF